MSFILERILFDHGDSHGHGGHDHIVHVEDHHTDANLVRRPARRTHAEHENLTRARVRSQDTFTSKAEGDDTTEAITTDQPEVELGLLQTDTDERPPGLVPPHAVVRTEGLAKRRGTVCAL